MSESQRTAVEAFASQAEAINEKVVAAAAACTEEQWVTVVAKEARPVGVVFHHIGFSYPFIIDWAGKVASGQGLPPVSDDLVHDFNRRHAEEHAAVSQADTVSMLRENGAELAAWIRTLQDE